MGFFDVFSDKAAKDAAAARQAGLRAGQTSADSAIDTGQGYLKDYGQQASQPFQSLYDRASRGYDAYGDASGANGAEGQARARSLFTSSPGYQEGIDQAVNATTRIGNAKGVATGNIIGDSTKLATDYASQHYNDYVSALAPWLSGAQSAASGNAAVLTNTGNALNQDQIYKGGIGFQTESGIGDAQAQADLDKNRASGAFWSALLGGADMALKASGAGGYGAKK
jgi:hypothetical protein